MVTKYHISLCHYDLTNWFPVICMNLNLLCSVWFIPFICSKMLSKILPVGWITLTTQTEGCKQQLPLLTVSGQSSRFGVAWPLVIAVQCVRQWQFWEYFTCSFQQAGVPNGPCLSNIVNALQLQCNGLNLIIVFKYSTVS